MNLTETLFDNGFTIPVRITNGKPSFSLTNGWMGMTTQNPDITMYKGNRCAMLSLQGSAPNPMDITDEYTARCNSMSVRYIGLYAAGRAIYETWSGVMPSDETIKFFLNEDEILLESMYYFTPRSGSIIAQSFETSIDIPNYAYINKFTANDTKGHNKCT